MTKLVQSKTIAELNRNYARGCHAYPERALRALRLYQLAPSQKHEIALLNSMPKGISDFAALLWLTTDGGVEDLGDVQYDYGTFYPDDELPGKGCHLGSPPAANKAFNEYYEAVARAVARHPRYMPRFFAISQFFGYRYDPNDLGYSKNTRLQRFFSGLLSELYKKAPRTFENYVGWTEYGKAALRDAMSHTPPSPY